MDFVYLILRPVEVNTRLMDIMSYLPPKSSLCNTLDQERVVASSNVHLELHCCVLRLREWHVDVYAVGEVYLEEGVEEWFQFFNVGAVKVSSQVERHRFGEWRTGNRQDSSASTTSSGGLGWRWSFTTLPCERFKRSTAALDGDLIEGAKSIPELLFSVLENMFHGFCGYIGSPIDPVELHLILAFVHLSMYLRSHNKKLIGNFFLPPLLPIFLLFDLLIIDF